MLWPKYTFKPQDLDLRPPVVIWYTPLTTNLEYWEEFKDTLHKEDDTVCKAILEGVTKLERELIESAAVDPGLEYDLQISDSPHPNAEENANERERVFTPICRPGTEQINIEILDDELPTHLSRLTNFQIQSWNFHFEVVNACSPIPHANLAMSHIQMSPFEEDESSKGSIETSFETSHSTSIEISKTSNKSSSSLVTSKESSVEISYDEVNVSEESYFTTSPDASNYEMDFVTCTEEEQHKASSGSVLDQFNCKNPEHPMYSK